MSELAQLTGLASASADVLPGHILSPFTLEEIAESEKEIQQFFLRSIASAAASASPGVGQAMLQEAQNQIAFGVYTHGAFGYWNSMLNAQLIGPLLYLALRAQQPQITAQAAKLLVTAENLHAVRDAVRGCAGYKPGPAPNARAAEAGKTSAAQTPNAPPSPGPNSSDSSANAA